MQKYICYKNGIKSLNFSCTGSYYRLRICFVLCLEMTTAFSLTSLKNTFKRELYALVQRIVKFRKATELRVQGRVGRPAGPGSSLSADKKPLCELIGPGACKINRGCKMLQVPCQRIPLGVSWQSDGLATCLRINIAYQLPLTV